MQENERVQENNIHDNSNQQLSRHFKGIWIPREIWLHPTLSLQAKALWSEIDSLYCESHKGCYASDEYLEGFMQLKRSRLHELYKELIDAECLIKVSFDGRRVIRKAILPGQLLSGKPVSGKPESMNPENRNPPLEDIHIVEQRTDVVVKKQENVVVKSAGQSLTKDDIFSAGLRFNWVPDEIEQAWKIYSSSTKLITDPLKYIEGIIHKIRQNSKTNSQKEQKCQKQQQKNMTDSSQKSKNVNVLPSVSDMPESPLAQFAFRHGRKPNSPNS